MTLQDLGNIGEFVGAIGVVVSLLYLAIQIRRSTAVARAESQRELMLTHAVHHRLVAQPELIEILRRGIRDFKGLSKNEQAQFHHYFSPLLDQTDSVFRMYRQGLAADETWELWRGIIASLLATPGGRYWWDTAGVAIAGRDLHEEFRRYLSLEAQNITPMNELWSFYELDE